MSKKIIVAIYIRVSTKKQVEEGYSLDAQLDILQKFYQFLFLFQYFIFIS